MIEFSNKIADALAEGLIPWRLPCLHRNVLNGKVYGGINPILLNLNAQRLKLTSPYWGTFAQWQMMNFKVKQPDILGWGSRILLYKEERLVRDCVYNFDQTIGEYKPPVDTKTDPGSAFDAIVQKAKIRIEYHTGTDCRWFGGKDERIRMPHKCMFELGAGKIDAYWDALGHEIFHFMQSRMDWNAHYDVNELRAEIGTSYLGAILGVKPLPLSLNKHHRDFTPSWIKILRNNPQVLFDVCDSVMETIDFLLNLINKKVIWQTNSEKVHGLRRKVARISEER